MHINCFGPQFPVLSASLTQHYLELLGLKQEPASLAYLNCLVYNHVRLIPWENQDLILNQYIELDIEKLILQYCPGIKGGLCYQLNATFSALLHTLGFDVNLHPAILYGFQNRSYQTPRLTHMVPRVSLEGKLYLADVSWGGMADPLCLSDQNKRCYHLELMQGKWHLFYTHNKQKFLQYVLENRRITKQDIASFTCYENAQEEREAAHKLMFYLFENT